MGPAGYQKGDVKEKFIDVGGREVKKYCRVCGERVPGYYWGTGGRRCVVCLHRTHRRHMASNNRVCRVCSGEELSVANVPGNFPDRVSFLHVADIHCSAGETCRRINLINNWLEGEKADYVLISGDLTGGGSGKEYELAAGWLESIERKGGRVAVVPGNHDIGYWGNVRSVGRQVTGRKYDRWIEIVDRPVEPCLRGPACVVVGLNSAHGISRAGFVNGYLGRNQRARAKEVLSVTPPNFLKVVLLHHPLISFKGSQHSILYGADAARKELAVAGADIFFWGHQHSFAAGEFYEGGSRYYAVQSPAFSARSRDGDGPGFVVVDWVFGSGVTIRCLRVSDDRIMMEEREKVEYRFKSLS